LRQVLVLTFAAIDASSALFPYLNESTITFNGELVTDFDPANRAIRYKYVDRLPITAVIIAEAPGFNLKTTETITFTFDRLVYNVSLAPQQFNLHFIPAEVVNTGAYQRVASDGSIKNNIDQFVNVAAGSGVAYIRKSIQVGGAATQDSSPEISQSYSALNISSTFTPGATPLQAWAALFTDQVPTTQSPFALKAKALDTVVFNAPNNATSLDIPVPDFADIAERNLVFNVPYKLNAAYFNIRVFPINPAQTARVNFGASDFCFSRVTLSRAVRYSNYDSPIVGGASAALFEAFITFADSVRLIEIGFPLETYNNTLSNWRDETVSGGIRPFPTASTPQFYKNFTWTQDVVGGDDDLFVLLGNKQWARDTNAKLYLLRDYILVQNVKKKRDE